jgi:hypothetical protein
VQKLIDDQIKITGGKEIKGAIIFLL